MQHASEVPEGRIATTTYLTEPWLIRPVVRDFELEDLWALPVWGQVDDFSDYVNLSSSSDFAKEGPLLARLLWQLRDLLGGLFGLGRISNGPPDEADRLPIPGTDERSLVERLPVALRHTADDIRIGSTPMVPLYRTDREFATELSNRTVHSVMHISWVERAPGQFQAQMAVFTKPRGLFGKAYMALIKPFRYYIVYPALLRLEKRLWAERGHPTHMPLTPETPSKGSFTLFAFAGVVALALLIAYLAGDR